jgi:bifunctional DNA-binding transcriptional regulator/antitoxin component of YhaV-PrlF toxin-antitoxin module
MVMAPQEGLSEEPRPFEQEPAELASVGYMRLKIDSAGRIVIPAEMRAAMLVKPSDTVTAEVANGELRIVSPEVVLRQIRALARQQKRPGVDEVDEFIADRREEALRVDERFDRLEREAAEIAVARNQKK